MLVFLLALKGKLHCEFGGTVGHIPIGGCDATHHQITQAQYHLQIAMV
jgi:hypothetical protein